MKTIMIALAVFNCISVGQVRAQFRPIQYPTQSYFWTDQQWDSVRLDEWKDGWEHRFDSFLVIQNASRLQGEQQLYEYLLAKRSEEGGRRDNLDSALTAVQAMVKRWKWALTLSINDFYMTLPLGHSFASVLIHHNSYSVAHRAKLRSNTPLY